LGNVYEYSVINVVVQLSSGIGLILISKLLTDTIMLKVFTEKNHFQNMKYIKTEAM